MLWRLFPRRGSRITNPIQRHDLIPKLPKLPKRKPPRRRRKLL